MLKAWRILTVVIGLVAAQGPVLAAVLTSPHFKLDSNVANNFGGFGSSTSYRLTDSGGETATGEIKNASIKVAQGYIPQTVQSIQLAVMPNGAVAYYPLDTNTGNQAYDVSSNENRGVLANSPAWVAGKIGRALSFNGSNQAVQVPSASTLNAETVTIEVWVKTTQNPASSSTIVEKGNGSGAFPYSLRLLNGGTVGFYASDGSGSPGVASTAVVNDGLWHFVAATRTKGSQLKIYVDGDAPQAVADSASGTSTNSTGVGIGSRPGGANYFSGSIDELKIFNRALISDDEAKNDYVAGNAGVTAAQTLPAVTSGVSQTTSADAVVRTDAAGYDLALSQDHDLRHTDAVTTLAAISASIGSPTLWSEGSTKGLGFTITGGSSIESKWGSNPSYKYAAIPGSATTFHGRGGLLSGLPERNTLQFRVDPPSSQKSGAYSNTVTFTATLRP